MSETKVKRPAWFWIVAIIALVWNLLGVLGLVVQLTMGEQMLAAMEPEMRAAYEAIPGWTTIVHAIGTISALLGAIALIMRIGAATILFAISLIAILVNNGYVYGVEQLQSVAGTGALVTTGFVIVIGTFLVWFSMMSKKRGYIG